jgi:large subunit ribosomal protein L24
MKFKKNDTVVVIAGKDKGVTGKIIEIDRALERVVVEGVNVKKKHVRPKGRGEKGTIIEKPFSIHASNVMIADPKTGKPSRISITRDEKKGRVRIAKKSGKSID